MIFTGAYLGGRAFFLAVLLWAYHTAQTVLFGEEVCREGSRARAGAR